ncbi:hypothetical protein XH81_10345 [Bradyrhizobium sp. CCBAU 25360]|uniref:ORC-CDC6 family AAA ATPase n=1 Tax=Bradyrhizobium sp. CCBAU 25360 TaxID=858425 RepID=UPI00230681B6|nr:hypothetical protein [Bradyrhizobium sp. CCBAU 25360]MDA9415244.1 hypothetical protein [Bradyrhizobium sp. CCBAU 25360]
MRDPFESYNARFVPPQTVAETFILREKQFAALCEQTNSLLIGPRGSGKTTLLKMLKVGAQVVAWKNRTQANALRRFRFCPIYVGADRQLEFIVGGPVADQNRASIDLLSKALLSFRVKFACLDTAKEVSNPHLRDIENMSHQFVDLGDGEVRLSRALSSVWDLKENTLSFLEVRSRLYWQLGEMNRFLAKIRHGQEVSPEEILDHAQYLSHDPIGACEAFVSLFNEITDLPAKIWALCVDELEIMPDQLQNYLFSGFRSIDQRIVLKLATSPFSKIDWRGLGKDGPMSGNDYTPINLGFTTKHDIKRNDARRFSARLLEALIVAETKAKQKGNQTRGPEVLGRSVITEANTSPDQKNAYRPPDGSHYIRFKSLLERDPAFAQFLRDRDIDLDQMHRSDENQRAGKARKYIWQVACRLAYAPLSSFMRPDRSIGERPPSRKALADIYLGYDSLLTMCEGNPRITISLMRPLVRRHFGTSRSIPFEDQAALVEEAIAKYVSLLSTIHVVDPTNNIQNMSIIDLIEAIGGFFSNEVTGTVFKPEPPLTFRIDNAVPKEYVDAIGVAMNQGAFVMLSDESGLFDHGSIKDARLRFSYLLCPLYHLPLTIGSPINLSRILSTRRPRTSRRALTQEDLFNRTSI